MVCVVFNNAEESLQDGSHLFATQHPLRSRCVIPPLVDIILITPGPLPVFEQSSTWKVQPTQHQIHIFLHYSTAAGTEGPELVFQATSEQMINAYAHVPRYATPSYPLYIFPTNLIYEFFSRPHGTVLANDIFSSGIIMSECVIYPPSIFRNTHHFINGNFFCNYICFFSTDFRQFELYMNVTGLDVRGLLTHTLSRADWVFFTA